MQLAEQGHALAQWRVGTLLVENCDEAACWFRKAAEQGLAVAQYELGLCYRWGRGVRINLEMALPG